MNTGPWLQNVSQKLASNGYGPLDPALYQTKGYKYVARRSGFELSKFGMVDRMFTFAEIEHLDAATLWNFSRISFDFANSNKSSPLPNGFLMCLFCFPVILTENVDPSLAEQVRQNSPPKHWAAQEMPVIVDVATGGLVYFESTPLWGAAYFAGMRREIESNLR
ncbi:MAG: hypothetical protein ACJ73D_11410 [Pyrinomonadaceae bacterium]